MNNTSINNGNTEKGESFESERSSSRLPEKETSKKVVDVLSDQFRISQKDAKEWVKKGMVFMDNKVITTVDDLLGADHHLEVQFSQSDLKVYANEAMAVLKENEGGKIDDLLKQVLHVSDATAGELINAGQVHFSRDGITKKIGDVLERGWEKVVIRVPSLQNLIPRGLTPGVSDSKMEVVFESNPTEEYKNVSIDVNKEDNAERADVILARYFHIPRSKARKWIYEGKVSIGDHRVVEKAGEILKSGQNLQVLIPKEIKKLQNTSNKKVDVVLETPDFIVVNKKENTVVHPDHYHQEDTLVQRLMNYTKGQLSQAGPPERSGVVHRLDKDTSGLLIFSKTNDAHDYFLHLFSERKIEKHYLALVHGTKLPETGTIDSPIGRDPQDRKKMTVSDSKTAKRAVSHFDVVETFETTTLVRVKIETGRTHQIRVHLTSIGHPIVGDPTYGSEKFDEAFEKKYKKKAPRIFLHAERLKFTSLDDSFQDVSAPLPEDLAEVLEKVRGKK